MRGCKPQIEQAWTSIRNDRTEGCDRIQVETFVPESKRVKPHVFTHK